MAYDGTITIGTKLDDKEFDAQILQLERKINDMERDLEISISTGEFAEDSKEAEELRVKIEKAKNQLITLNKQKEKYNSTGYTTEGLGGLGDPIGKAFNKIGRIVLSIFSIRSAYGAMQRASTTLAQYNSQYAADLEYIRYALVQAVAPILEKVVKLAYTLLGYMNYLSKIWFGKPIFAENLAKNFAKASKSTSEIKKNLQTSPFDEMNVLTDTSDSGISGGGAVAPSMDPSMLQGEVPNWLKWIADNKDLIIKALIGIALAVGLIKLNNLIGGLEILKPLLKIIKTFLKAHGTTLAGILAIISGIAIIIDGIIKYLKDPSWDNFIEIMTGITFVVGGVMLLFGGIPALITAIILSVAALGLAIYKHWDEIKATLNTVGDWINEHIIQPVANFFKNLWQGIIGGVNSAVQTVKDVFSTVVNFFRDLISQIVNAFKSLGIKAGEVISSAFRAVVNAVLRTIESVLNAPIRAINRLIGVINNVPGINLRTLSTFNLPRLAVGGLINNPGRGVPLGGGSAIGGEAGREGVIPLTDSQAMETLGEAIGRYITINANITNTMNGRIISRQLQQIRNDREFAYNG